MQIRRRREHERESDVSVDRDTKVCNDARRAEVPSHHGAGTRKERYMSTSLEELVREMFEALDALQIEVMAGHLDDDAQAVDELSGGWRRGRGALEEYLTGLKEMVQGVESRVSSVQTIEWGDVGIVTCELEQTYRAGEEIQEIRAPTSIVCRRRNGEWKVVLLHSVPLPQQPAP
jgi:ketosteroid isomerase-like protein